MILTHLFKKPRWLAKDATVRRDAVARESAPELIADLARLAREDDDAQVRLNALRRIADPALAQRMASDDPDVEVRKHARALWLDLLTGIHAASPPAAERLRLLRAQDDAELIERMAVQAAEPELRRAALERIDKPTLLLARALEDADPAIRLHLIERIDDERQLERIAERARKTDKQLSRRARERIQSLRIARGDDDTLQQHGRQLCERIEQCLRAPLAQAEEEALIAQWDALQSRMPAPLQARFATARHLLATARAPRPAPSPDVAAPPPVDAIDATVTEATAPKAEAAAVPTPEPADVAANLLAQARFAASLDEAQAARREHRERQRALLQELQQAQQECSQALDAGASARAHAAKARIDALRAQIEDPLPAALAQALDHAQARYAELSRWQHWADAQRRRQLCEEIEALPGSGLHPDAVAAKVHDARREWQQLDQVEAGSARPGGLARRFHTACRAALEPAQGYFRKRQELREGHAAQLTTLLGRIAALPAEDAAMSDVTALRRETVDALRSLDRIEPRERKVLAQSLKSALGMLDAHTARHDAGIEATKTALIAQAQALFEQMPRGAAASARELQQRWREIGNGRRARDQAQWTQFRACIDRIFAQLDAQRSERMQREHELHAQAVTLCTELETLAAAAEPERGALARIEAAWAALRVGDADLRQRHDTALTRLREQATRRDRARRHARFSAWQACYRLCRAAETAAQPSDSLQSQWQDAASGDAAMPLLRRRFDAALAGNPVTNAADDEAHRDVLVELEALAGAPSPAQDQERRRLRQVERLAARMRGQDALDPAQELTALLARWAELDAVSDPQLDMRLQDALSAVLESLP